MNWIARSLTLYLILYINSISSKKTFYSAVDEAVSFMGRYEVKNGTITYEWSGINIEVTFEGITDVEIILDDVGNFYNIILNGVIDSILNTTGNNGPTNYQILSNLQPSTTYNLLITKRTEASLGLATFIGFDLTSNDEVESIIYPKYKKISSSNRKIEFIGDSITCGFGDEGKYPCGWTPATENNYKAFGPVISRFFGAEYHIQSWSGKGLVRNYGDKNITSVNPFPVYYPLVLPTIPTTYWNFSNWTPDMIVIDLGTNDYSTQPYPPQNIFEIGYKDFIANIQKMYNNDSIPFFLICGPMITGACCTYVQNVANELSALGEPVYYIDLQGILTFPTDYGCDGHPNTIGHQIMAAKSIPTIQSIMGW